MDFRQQTIAIFEKHLSEWESNPQRMESGYDYESTYAEMMQKVEREVLQLSVEKLQTRFGQIEINKLHVLAQNPTKMSISGFAQETMCYIGQHIVFKEEEEEEEEVINTITTDGF